MLNNFITLDSLGNFTIQLIIIVIATEFTKKLLGNEITIIKKKIDIKTERIVFFYALLLSGLNCYGNYKLNNLNQNIFVSIILVYLNAIVISYLATASYDKIIKSYDDRHSQNTSL